MQKDRVVQNTDANVDHNANLVDNANNSDGSSKMAQRIEHIQSRDVVSLESDENDVNTLPVTVKRENVRFNEWNYLHLGQLN